MYVPLSPERSSFILHPSSFTWALVPTKDLLRAKTRLAGVLAPAERRSLVLAMLTDVLGTLRAAPQLTGVALISRDPEVRALAARSGALLLDDPGDDLNDSLRAGAAQLAVRGARELLVVPADVPLVTRADVEALVGALRMGAQIALAPAHDDGGTNALALTLPSRLMFQFGERSFERHLRLATNLGLRTAIHRSDTLGLDIDTLDDLCLLAEVSGATATYTLMQDFRFAPCEIL